MFSSYFDNHGSWQNKLPENINPYMPVTALFIGTLITHGASGVFSYKLWDDCTSKYYDIAILFNDPVGHSNNFAIGIYGCDDLECNQCLYNRMQNDKSKNFVRCQSSQTDSCSYTKDSISVTGTMTDGRHSVLRIQIYRIQNGACLTKSKNFEVKPHLSASTKPADAEQSTEG